MRPRRRGWCCAVERGLGNRVKRLSVDAAASLFFTDGSRANAPTDNPEICVYKAGRSDYCAEHGQPTPEATEAPTALPPTLVPSPTTMLEPTVQPTVLPPTATEEPDAQTPERIFIPVTLCSAALDALAAPATAVAATVPPDLTERHQAGRAPRRHIRLDTDGWLGS